MSTIMVIDDDYSTTSLIKMLLEMEGYTVQATTTISSALDETNGDVSAMIIDCYLSNDESGLDFVGNVRRGETQLPADVPAILVSGDQRLEDKAKAVGANLFMLKPYSPNELTAQVKKLATGD